MSDERKQDHEHRDDAKAASAHFTNRRKIVAGLVGAPVFMTFSPQASAISSFARCADYQIGGKYTTLPDLYVNGLDDPNGSKRVYSGTKTITHDSEGNLLTESYEVCDGVVFRPDSQEQAVLSVACLTSFTVGGGNRDNLKNC